MKRYAFLFLIVVTAGCKNEPPVEPPKAATIGLTAEDASCTEAWLKASTTETPATVRLLRDGQRVSDLRLLTSDSLLLDEGLIPRRTYTYQLQKLGNDSSVVETSSSVQITTMDTTSHNITWQSHTLGDGNSSVLYDVAIINDTLAYAVGEMYLTDSTGQFDPLLYNLAKWDGHQWELKRVTVMFRGNLITPPLYGIYAFSATDIWLAGGMAIHGNGISWVGYDVRAITGYDTLSFTKCWGQNSSDMYFVGLRGSLAYYANGTWQRVESGTTVTLNDVWGGSNRWVGENVVLVAAGNKYTAGETKIFKLSGSSALDTLPWAIPIRTRQSVWFSARSRVYTCGSGIFTDNGNGWTLVPGIPAIYSNRVRGNAENDVFVVGDYGLVVHSNGTTWHVYSEVGLPNGNYESVAVKNNFMLAVGWIGNRAVILRGTRR